MRVISPRLVPAWMVLAACSSASPSAETPASAPPIATQPTDAAPDAPPPDAGPSPELAAAPAWVFRYDTPDRAETWTLRHHGDLAMIDVESTRGVVRYLGSAAAGTTLKLDVSTSTGRVQLDCRRSTRRIGSSCRDRKPPALDVLDCFVEGFTEPMPFALAPGVAYVVTSACTGYQTIPRG